MSVLTRKFFTLTVFIVGLCIQSAYGIPDTSTSSGKPLVYTFSIEEGIFEPALRIFNTAMDEADSLNADWIVLRLDTYGGAVDVADQMRTRLLNSDIPTAVFIVNNAASAGALISVACDSIYMTEAATIGAAVVVEAQGGAAAEKYQSYFREKFRATAEKQGRDPDIAEAMVNPDVHIPGVIDSGKILTFTAKEALANNYCDAIIAQQQDVYTQLGITNPRIVEYNPTWVDNIIRLFRQPAVSGILISVIFFGIFFELQSPGIGFPLIAAVVAAAMYFTPLYLDGLAANWEILLFFGGIALIAVELFVIPGFGIAGISGIVITLGGLVLSLVRNVQFDFTFTDTGDFGEAILIVAGGLLATIAGLALIGRNLANSPLTRLLIFTDATRKEEGYTTDTFQGKPSLTGSRGTAVTPLHPSGTVEIAGERYDAYTAGEYIEAGREVEVVEAIGFSVKVKMVN